jgi:hypothetical protein
MVNLAQAADASNERAFVPLAGAASGAPQLPADEHALSILLLEATEAAERARIRALEALVIGLALGCLYFLVLSPVWRPLTAGDVLVVGSLGIACISIFAFYATSARAHLDIVEHAQARLRAALAGRNAPPTDVAGDSLVSGGP